MDKPKVSRLKNFVCLIFSILLLQAAYAQEYIGQRNFVGLTLGTMTYKGIYSKGSTYISHTSMSGSGYYSKRILLPKQLYVRGELMMGELAGNFTNDESIAEENRKEFRSYVLELSAKVEYEILNLNLNKATPYVIGGVGSYFLFDYQGKPLRNKPMKDRIGFVAPVGAGIKYRFNSRIKLFAEGNFRFFPRNLDNYPDESVSNPNNYYTLVVGASFALNKRNRLW